MDPRDFVERRTRRYMAQALEEFEQRIERPLQRGAQPSAADIEATKRAFRKRLQDLASDCIDLMPSDIEINAYEPIVRR